MNQLALSKTGLLLTMACLLLQACGTPASAAPTDDPAPTAESAATPLSTQVSLTAITFKEEAQSPQYWIAASYPRLVGSDDKRAQKFNQRVNDLVQGQIEYFRENLLSQMPSKPISTGSAFNVNYTTISQQGSVFSLKFDFTGYADGAAHPYHYALTLNYDIESGKELTLAELFPKDSNYLDVLSRYCIMELSKREIGFYGGFQQGAAPLAENYRNWNITPDGILITFDEYQVAPYAAGPQIVTVPYQALAEVQVPVTGAQK